MEEKFCSVALDIIGLSVFNYEFGSVTKESPVIKAVYSALVEAELNIHYTYPFLNRPAGKSALVINVEHPEVAVDSLRRHQFEVLYQGDVSR